VSFKNIMFNLWGGLCSNPINGIWHCRAVDDMPDSTSSLKPFLKNPKETRSYLMNMARKLFVPKVGSMSTCRNKASDFSHIPPAVK
jgi:hypothetical protein